MGRWRTELPRVSQCVCNDKERVDSICACSDKKGKALRNRIYPVSHFLTKETINRSVDLKFAMTKTPETLLI
jgi:hypothetical protein